MKRPSLLPLIVVLALVSGSACIDREGWARAEERTRLQRTFDPDSPYGRELARAREAMEMGDGLRTKLVADSGKTEVDLMKTPTRDYETATYGVSERVRARLPAGENVLVVERVDAGYKYGNMWLVTDGDVSGWVPEANLEKVPGDSLPGVPDPRTVALGYPVETLGEFTRSPFCETFRCSLQSSTDRPGGGVINHVGLTGDRGWRVEMETMRQRIVAARLVIAGRARLEAEGRNRLHRHDLPLADAFVRTILGETCPAAERLARENITRPFAADSARASTAADSAAADSAALESARSQPAVHIPAVQCGEWTAEAAQIERIPTLTMTRAAD